MEIKEEINQTPKKDHAGVLAKVKKAISAALMAGMLASPIAAKEMKNQTTHYNEPTRVERNYDQLTPAPEPEYTEADMQATYNDAMKLLQDIIDSDLNKVGKPTALEIVKQSTAVGNEVTTYINRLSSLIGRLNLHSNNFSWDIGDEVLNLGSTIGQGKIRTIANENKWNLSMDKVIDGVAQEWEKTTGGIVGSDMVYNALHNEYYYHEFPEKEIRIPKGVDFREYIESIAFVSDKNGIRGNMYGIRNHPEHKALGMSYIAKNVDNMSEIMPDSCGTVPARKALILVNASIDATNEMINHLEKVGYKFNESNLQPHIIERQNQADLGMSR